MTYSIKLSSSFGRPASSARHDLALTLIDALHTHTRMYSQVNASFALIKLGRFRNILMGTYSLMSILNVVISNSSMFTE